MAVIKSKREDSETIVATLRSVPEKASVVDSRTAQLMLDRDWPKIASKLPRAKNSVILSAFLASTVARNRDNRCERRTPKTPLPTKRTSAAPAKNNKASVSILGKVRPKTETGFPPEKDEVAKPTRSPMVAIPKRSRKLEKILVTMSAK